MDDLESELFTYLDIVSSKLRERLKENPTSRDMNESASQLISRFLDQIAKKEIKLLPKKKQRALVVLKVLKIPTTVLNVPKCF